MARPSQAGSPFRVAPVGEDEAHLARHLLDRGIRRVRRAGRHEVVHPLGERALPDRRAEDASCHLSDLVGDNGEPGVTRLDRSLLLLERLLFFAVGEH